MLVDITETTPKPKGRTFDICMSVSSMEAANIADALRNHARATGKEHDLYQEYSDAYTKAMCR